MYQQSLYSGKLKNTETGDIFLKDDRDIKFLNFLEWQKNENNQLIFVNFFIEEQNEFILVKSLQKETDKYKKRILDGQEYYAGISAKFRLAKLSGQISEEDHAIKEEACIPIRSEILAGQWISGMNKLIELGTEIIGQSLYDELYNTINTYIESSYTIEEISLINKTPTIKK